LHAVINAAGVIIQKKAHARNSNASEQEQRKYYLNPWWWAGFLVYASGNGANALALTFAAQSIVTPLASTYLMANAVFSPMYLGEKLTQTDIVGIVCVLIGCALIVLFGVQNTATYCTLSLVCA